MDPLGGVRSSMAQGKAMGKGAKNKMKMAKGLKAKTAKFNKAILMALLTTLLFGILLGFTVFIPFSGFDGGSRVKMVYLLLVGIFLLLGIRHSTRMYEKIDWAHPDRFGPEFLLTFGLAVFFGFGVLVVYLVLPGHLGIAKDVGSYGVLMSSSALAFIVPYLFLKAFDSAELVQDKRYHLWHYPKNYIEKQPTWKMDELVYANMIFNPVHKEDRIKKIEVRLPTGGNFGEVMYLFINDYNENRSPDQPIDDLRREDGSLGWLFSTHKSWWKFNYSTRYLDPELTIEQNNVTQQMNIYFTRVIKDGTYE